MSNTAEPMATATGQAVFNSLSKVEELADERHIEFIRDFQKGFDALYSTSAASKHGAQKTWVRKNVVSKFLQEFKAIVTKAFLLVRIFLS